MLPKIIIFDLDYTLFNFNLDYSSLKSNRRNGKPDWSGQTAEETEKFLEAYQLFSDVKKIFQDIQSKNIKIAIF